MKFIEKNDIFDWAWFNIIVFGLLFAFNHTWADTCISQCTSTCTIVPAPVPTAPPCRVGTPVAKQAVHRGLYVSLLASNIGAYTIPTQLQNILGNRAKEDDLLKFAITHSFDSFSYYDLSRILPGADSSSRLAAFIEASRGCGIVEHVGVGAIKADWDRIKASGQFDGAITEIEFWNEPNIAANFQSYLGQLKYIRSIGLKVQTYLGWLNRIPGQTEQQVANQIAPLIDRAMLHCYVKDATQAYNYCASRIGAFQNANKNIQIVPIFSAESPKAKAGTEVFMGDWLRLNSIPSAEALFRANFAQATGYQYYDYAFLSAALGGR